MKKVREGYKMTELGEIPNEWHIKTINDLIKENIIIDVMDGNHGAIHPKASDYVDIGIPFIMANNLKNGKLDIEDCKFISYEQAKSLRKGFAIEGDVLLTHKGTLGETAIVPKLKYEYIMLTPQVTYYRLSENNVLINRYLKIYFDSKKYQDKLKSFGSQSTRDYVGIIEQRKLSIILPTIEEQEKISSILSKVDEQIDNVEALIKKNKELKKGLMQTLLTKGIGHTKFKKTEIGEIPEAWEVIKLNKYGYIFGGNAFKSSSFTTEYRENNYQVIRMGNVQLGKLDLEKNPVFLSENLVGEKEKKYLLKETDILISLTGTVNKTDYGNISWVDKNNKYLLNQRVGCLRNDNREFNNRYYYYFLQSNIFRNQFFECGVGGTGNQANVSIADLNNIKVLKLPIIEQEKIASILLEVDSKIEKFQSKKQRLEELKKGLIQQLLNGKIRV